MYVYSESVNRTYPYAIDWRSHGREGGEDAEAAHAGRRRGRGAAEDQERQRLRGDQEDKRRAGGARARGHPRARSKRRLRRPVLPGGGLTCPCTRTTATARSTCSATTATPAARSATRRSAASPPRWRPQCGRASSRA